MIAKFIQNVKNCSSNHALHFEKCCFEKIAFKDFLFFKYFDFVFLTFTYLFFTPLLRLNRLIKNVFVVPVSACKYPHLYFFSASALDGPK